MIIVVMGVAGAGKSTLAETLATALDWIFIEGDDYHPAANIAKMVKGEALNDDDRATWLEHLHTCLVELDGGGAGAVVACSALKASYRSMLAEDISSLRFVFLRGSEETIGQRLSGRRRHFMPPALLESQLAALEPPQDAITVPIDMTTDAQVDHVLQTISGALHR